MSTKKRVLLVDDEEAFTRLLKLNLEATGHFVVQTENWAPKALPAAREFRPDVVVLDVMMPGMDGGEVANRIKADPRLSSTKIVFLTAAVKREEVGSHGGLIGGFPYLAKPLEADELIAWIDRNVT